MNRISIAIDREGDVWVSRNESLWRCLTTDAGKLTKDELIELYGPLLMIGGPYEHL